MKKSNLRALPLPSNKARFKPRLNVPDESAESSVIRKDGKIVAVTSTASQDTDVNS